MKSLPLALAMLFSLQVSASYAGPTPSTSSTTSSEVPKTTSTSRSEVPKSPTTPGSGPRPTARTLSSSQYTELCNKRWRSNSIKLQECIKKFSDSVEQAGAERSASSTAQAVNPNDIPQKQERYSAGRIKVTEPTIQLNRPTPSTTPTRSDSLPTVQRDN